MLFEQFKSFIKEPGFITPESTVLLAVSGGIDSMVMMNLFYRLELNCTVAHCNFQLRGEESDFDEQFVRQQAGLLNYNIFVSKLETEEYASENHLSIQMAARELRYTWFEKLLKAHKFNFIAVGHNKDDAMETFFIQLGRGTGIAGLTGISFRTGNIIRPLLFATRGEIAEYANENSIAYREDSSNKSDKYIRNYIRHNIIPELMQVFPNFRKTFSRTLDNLGEANILYKESLEQHIKSVVHYNEEYIYIDIQKIQRLKAPRTILFEITRHYGFSSAMTDEIYLSGFSISGKKFYSSTHILVKDRNYYIISKNNGNTETRIYIDEDCRLKDYPINLKFEKIEYNHPGQLIFSEDIAYTDYSKLVFPLILRKWHYGDYFVPIGMTGMKKLSDFFVDIKLSLPEKENIWLLTSNSQIVWIIGKRLDERYKITSSTSKIYKITITDDK